jgi:hypothetical protein
MVEDNIWGTFQEAGFEFDVKDEPDRVKFDEATCSELEHSRRLSFETLSCTNCCSGGKGPR